MLIINHVDHIYLLLYLRRSVSICSKVRPRRPYQLSRVILDLLDDLTSTHHASPKPSDGTGIMAQI